jgi:pimeloyl-ACP methyl ester carboxylesterase
MLDFCDMKTKSKILLTFQLCLLLQLNTFSQNVDDKKMPKPKTIVFIHGLWMHASSWQQWMDFFNTQGYKTINPGWPGDSLTVADCRVNSQSIANRGVEEIVESYAKIIRTLPEPPIVIGHSFGGLIAQILLSRGLASACIAIDPAPMKGVWQLPFSAIKASFPVIGNPFNMSKAKSLTYEQFRYGFANAVNEKEAKELYELWTIPAPCRPLFQAATASFSGIQTKVNTQNTSRGPLLITGGEKDNQAPPILGRASVKKYNKKVISDFKLFEGRGHSLIVDSGWREIAEYSINWLNKNGL